MKHGKSELSEDKSQDTATDPGASTALNQTAVTLRDAKEFQPWHQEVPDGSKFLQGFHKVSFHHPVNQAPDVNNWGGRGFVGVIVVLLKKIDHAVRRGTPMYCHLITKSLEWVAICPPQGLVISLASKED